MPTMVNFTIWLVTVAEELSISSSILFSVSPVEVLDSDKNDLILRCNVRTATFSSSPNLIDLYVPLQLINLMAAFRLRQLRTDVWRSRHLPPSRVTVTFDTLWSNHFFRIFNQQKNVKLVIRAPRSEQFLWRRLWHLICMFFHSSKKQKR